MYIAHLVRVLGQYMGGTGRLMNLRLFLLCLDLKKSNKCEIGPVVVIRILLVMKLYSRLFLDNFV